MKTGVDCWQVVRADRMSVIVDAADYLRIARQAMTQARKRIGTAPVFMMAARSGNDSAPASHIVMGLGANEAGVK